MRPVNAQPPTTAGSRVFDGDMKVGWNLIVKLAFGSQAQQLWLGRWAYYDTYEHTRYKQAADLALDPHLF